MFRAAFIAVGAVLMQYHWWSCSSGCFLLTGIKLLWSPEQKIEPERNPLIRLFRRVVPMTTDVHGPQFLVKTEDDGTPRRCWSRCSSWR